MAHMSTDRPCPISGEWHSLNESQQWASSKGQGGSSRSSIKCGPDVRLHPSSASHCRIPKVREQDSVGSIWRYRTEDVLGLDVSMGNAFAVDVDDAAEDLTDNPSNLDLFKDIVLCQKRKEIAPGRELSKDVPVCVRWKGPVIGSRN